MANTTHLELPLLAAAQAQKHVTHNDALQRLDALVQLSVKDRHLTSPPGSPSDGDRYIPASGASGDWEDWDLNVAWYVDGVWTKLAPRGGWIAYVEDEGLVLIHDGSGWVKLPAASETWRILSASAVAATHTGNPAETTLATVTVPGGAMGPNGVLRITTTWSHTGSTNAKTPRVKFNGFEYCGLSINNAGHLGSQYQTIISNRNSATSQVGGPKNISGLGSSSQGPQTTTVDTSVDVDITMTASLSDAGESLTLERYIVELLYHA